ncbi:DNA-binding NarL/FixJ family response regulator [Caldalkalibacillus uzonensis]|uniref:DNA-binding NarL/FixJ family response regulator n=1 Tax=Caldalkalibacillus uzonensis TaxID=353224 RepID=A0ABU0CWB9_9BACI|nr:LuxR C-terminal-related transcriptional regulator [Caldalkalibacillus uzonensis]MDQ0340719.1 DNA-binding NarL/FixJ family response regulator [Caldalkalibacillus uzonensis]
MKPIEYLPQHNVEIKEQEYKRVVHYIAKRYRLTRREEEILLMLSLYGYSNEELSKTLFVSQTTVKNHIHKILKKTRTSSTRGLLSMVIDYFYTLKCII